MRYGSLILMLACLPLGSALATGETPLTGVRASLEKWMETRQVISKTKSDWQTDRETLNQTAALYERELQSLAEQFSKVDTNRTQAVKEMQEAEALKQSAQEALAQAHQFAKAFEAQVKALVPRLPAPLQELLKKDLGRMPADPANTKMLAAERAQVLVGVLNEIDKFNNSVNVFNEKRKNPAGEEVSVEVLYVGLGAAYFVNETTDFAGVGAPGPEGWQWAIKPELAASVKEAIKIYRNERTARFVTLPINLQ